MTDPVPAPAFRDEDIVYVDPDTKTVVGLLEWSRSGNPKSKLVPPAPPSDNKRERRGRKYFPFGTYRSMKRVFQLEGKVKKQDGGHPLEEVIEKALKEAYWN